MYWCTHKDLSVRTVEDETIVFDRRQGRIHQLNPTASLIWACCDGQHSVEKIVAALQHTFEVPFDIAVRDVHRLLHELHQQMLIQTSDTILPFPSKECTHGPQTPVLSDNGGDPPHRP